VISIGELAPTNTPPDSENDYEPDQHALVVPNKRGSQKMTPYYSPESKKESEHKRKLRPEDRMNSEQSAVSMLNEEIKRIEINSVTDSYLRNNEDDDEPPNKNYGSIKKEMIKYLSRVADKNKPMFVFNQKLNLGGDSDTDSSCDTPKFSLVALIKPKH
jgi:hypothetical protein